MISKGHPNRKPYNWLIYNISDRFLEAAAPRIRGVVYDLGCGEMPFREWISDQGCRYIGVDWSETPHKLKAEIVADLSEPLPIDDEQADTLISWSVMEHLREPQRFLLEAHRILKPGGHLIIQVPFMWHVHEAPHDYYRFTRFGLEYLLKQAGFVDIDVSAQTGFWVMWTLKFNYQSRRLIRGPSLLKLLLKMLLYPIWMVNQWLALGMDRVWKAEGETAGYFIVARKG